MFINENLLLDNTRNKVIMDLPKSERLSISNLVSSRKTDNGDQALDSKRSILSSELKRVRNIEDRLDIITNEQL